MKAIVTGGAGFIGSHVVDSLLAEGMDVVVIDDLSGGFRNNVNPLAQFIEGTILDHDLIDQVFEKHHFDYVFHLAAYAAEGLSHFIKRFNYMNNAVGSMNLINAAVNFNSKCFVFTSSIAVYGANQVPMTEDLDPMPEDSYGIAKFCVEKELQISHEVFGLDYIIFRPHNVYGERQNLGDRYRNVIGIFMNQIMQGKSLSVFGDGTQTRAFSYVGDVAPIIAKSVMMPQAYGQIFNVGADIPYSINTLTEEVSKAMSASPNINHLPPRNEVVHAYSSHEKAQRLLGYTAKVDLSEGLSRMAIWAKENGARQGKLFRNIEIVRNLPQYWLGE
ncbi:MAG: NAD-dependent epimerase/dehydratase family protein [Chloroflexi bacterium]|nr:NAD-dependent epimerase/dehydratase family protein [Chloroflexota bacterium]